MSRKLADRQRKQRAHADRQDQQADHRGENRPLDENVGEMTHPRLFSLGVGLGLLVGWIELLTISGVPFCSLSWPALTMVSPSLMPPRTAIWSPRVSPVVTKVCFATSLGASLVPVFCGDVHRIAVRIEGDGRLRHGHVTLLGACRNLGAGIHTGQQFVRRIFQRGADRDVARRGSTLGRSRSACR